MSNQEDQKFVVLAADDDENAHLLLRHAFQKAAIDARLFQVNSGKEALDYLEGTGKFEDRDKFPFPTLLLLDLKMPIVSGYEVLEQLRKKPALSGIPVIVFSSSELEQDVTTAYQLGCHSYVIKPTTLSMLLDFAKAMEHEFLSKGGRNGPGLKSEFKNFTVRPSNFPNPEMPGGERAKAQLKREEESPELFRLLVEQVKDYAIFMLDREGHILSWNEGAQRIKGYEAEEVIGKHFSIFYPRPDRDVDKPALELKMALEMGRYEEEGWQLRKDGSRFWANLVVSPLNEKDGTLRGFAKVTRDLTQRKIQDDNIQRLLDSEERFRLLVDQVKDYAIFILDARGHVASWNQGARRLKGYNSEEIIGKHFSIFYTPEDLAREHPARELTIAIRDGRYEEEGWRVRKDGTRFWANVVITALWDKRGNLSGFAKVTRDLTLKKEQQDALRRKTEELEAFAHTLSHDLRSPVRSIASFAQILRNEAKELRDIDKTYLEKIQNAARSMEAMIRDLLRLSQVSVAPVPEDIVSLEESIQEALDLHEAEVKKANARIEIAKPLPHIRGNRTLLVQIFSNLFSNAIKFMPPKRSAVIEVFAVRENMDWEIHVKDNGVGIPARFQAAIFNPFERGAADAKTGGSGIGLAIVKRAAERLGAKIIVQSEEGQGSDFILRLGADLVVYSDESNDLDGKKHLLQFPHDTEVAEEDAQEKIHAEGAD